MHPFHLAFPVDDLAAARAFYGGVLGCPEGRSDAAWIDFNLFGHQIVAHLDPAARRQAPEKEPRGDPARPPGRSARPEPSEASTAQKPPGKQK